MSYTGVTGRYTGYRELHKVTERYTGTGRYRYRRQALQELQGLHGGIQELLSLPQAVGAALLWSFEQTSGSAWTPEVLAAWTSVYDIVTSVMMKGIHAGVAGK